MAELVTHKRGNKWEYRFEVASVNGKRRYVQKSGFATKKEAIAVGTDAMKNYNATGTAFQPSETDPSSESYWYFTAPKYES